MGSYVIARLREKSVSFTIGQQKLAKLKCKEKKKKEKQQTIQEPWDHFKRCICIIKTPEGEERTGKRNISRNIGQ